MADPQRNNKLRHNHQQQQQQQPSRLQRRAPSSLQINREVEWNVAIPLLSPLASSPPPLLDEVKPQEAPKCQHSGPAEAEKVVVAFQKWQHPAAPFCYEPASIVPSFVPV